MDYAVVLYFDDVTESKIQSLINNAASFCGNRYMLDVKIPPHVTICAVKSDEEDLLVKEAGELADRLKGGGVCWASIGVFNPNVLFLSPVLNRYLLSACELANEKMLSVAEAGDNGHYLPYKWVPHTAIATKLSGEELISAFGALQKEFAPIVGKVNRVAIARCNPYKELKIWNLTD